MAMPVGIEAWLTEVPPITRGWLVLSVATSVAVVSLLYLIDFKIILTTIV